MKERTLAEIVDRFNARGAEIAFVHRRGYRRIRWSYAQVSDAARKLARELLDRGIVPGDKVLLWGRDCPEWVASFFACILRGAVVVPMDRSASPEFALRVCRQANAKLRIGSGEQSGIDLSIPTLTFEVFPELMGRHLPAPLPLPEITGQDAAEIVFTSGTTGDPKGVVLSHRNILANLEPLEREIGKYIKYERFFHPLRFLNLLPLSHVFGQFLGLFIPQILGGTVIFQETLNPAEIIRTVKREKVSVLVAVPKIMDAIRAHVERGLESSGSMDSFRRGFHEASNEHFVRRWWRFRRIHRQFGWKFWAFISGGASLTADSDQFWSRMGFAVVQGYGLTETTSLISVNHPFNLGRGSIGRVLPGREVKIAADGEILVRGDSIAKSYIQGKEVKPVSRDEGWFRTGDIGAVDEQGYLYFKGRRKNVIVGPEGMNIYPEDLEAALRCQPEVRDCVVVGIEQNGNAVACGVLILQNRHQNPEPVVERANASLAEFQRMRHWVIWPDEDFPRASTHKPHISLIQEFVNSRFSGLSHGETGIGTLADLITRVTGRRIENISGDSSLAKDLNLNSIERVELLSALENRYQIELDESKFTAARTVADLQQMLGCPMLQATDYYYPRWAQAAPVSVLRTLIYYLLIWPVTACTVFPRVRGKDNLSRLKGPLLFVSNHITQVDIAFILFALPLRFRHRLAVAMIGEMLREMRNPPPGLGFFKELAEKASYALLVALFNVFPLPQRTGFRKSFAYAGESVDRGWSILVFPEGTRTQDGEVNPFRAGIGILATNLDTAIVPIRIEGLFELKKKNQRFAPPGSVSVHIGKPVRYAPGTDAAEIAADLEERVRSLGGQTRIQN